MKKILFMMVLLMVGMAAIAQDKTLNNGVWEKKVVVTADSVKAGTLYIRALEALSDWAGSQGKSKIGIDVQDKDEGLVVYKGYYYLGYGKRNFMYGWDTFANFTMKIRCKDGRAQIAVSVPSIMFKWTADNTEGTVPIDNFLPTYTYKGDLTIKRAGTEVVPKMPQMMTDVINALGERIKNGSGDDF